MKNTRIAVFSGEGRCRKVKDLLEWGVEPSDIAVIATYAAQVWLLLRDRFSGVRKPSGSALNLEVKKNRWCH